MVAMFLGLLLALGSTWGGNVWAEQWGDQCTAFAAEQVHARVRVWPAFSGDALRWADSARAGGWPVSQVPREQSVLVLQPGTYKVQSDRGRWLMRVGHTGHVAWVQYVNSPSVVAVLDRNGAGGKGRDGQMMVDIEGTTAQFIYIDP